MEGTILHFREADANIVPSSPLAFSYNFAFHKSSHWLVGQRIFVLLNTSHLSSSPDIARVFVIPPKPQLSSTQWDAELTDNILKTFGKDLEMLFSYRKVFVMATHAFPPLENVLKNAHFFAQHCSAIDGYVREIILEDGHDSLCQVLPFQILFHVPTRYFCFKTNTPLFFTAEKPSTKQPTYLFTTTTRLKLIKLSNMTIQKVMSIFSMQPPQTYMLGNFLLRLPSFQGIEGVVLTMQKPVQILVFNPTKCGRMVEEPIAGEDDLATA